LKYLPENISSKVEHLFTPENIVLMGGTLAAYAGSHAIGVGIAADVVLGSVGAIALGAEAATVAKDFYSFAKLSANAGNEQELELAAQHLAKGLSTATVDLAAILVGKKVLGKSGGI